MHKKAVRMDANEKTLKVSDEKMSRSHLLSDQLHDSRLGLARKKSLGHPFPVINAEIST